MDRSGFEHIPHASEHHPFTYRPADTLDPPYVTIVTAFSGDTYALSQTARSVLGQSLQRWEWLIATGETRRDEALTALVEHDSRVRFVAGLDQALGQARADFVLQLPVGNELTPTAAEEWFWFLVSHPWTAAVKTPVADAAPAPGPGARLIRRRALSRGRTDLSAAWPLRRHRARVPLDLPAHNTLVKSRRRLLFLVPWVTTGGADKFTVDLVGELRARDWEVTLVTTLAGDNSWLPRVTRLTPDVFSLPELLSPTDYPRFVHYLVESRRPDVILISNSLFAYGALPYLRRIAEGTSIADYCHSVVEGWLDGGYPRLSVDARHCLDLQITSSRNLKAWMTERGADPERVEVCYIGTKLGDRERPAGPVDVGLPANGPIVLYPCRITHEKQPAVFAETILALRENRHDIHAVVAGEGPYLEWLRRFFHRHGLDEAVTFTGAVTNDRVRELMSVADCVFLPSKFEGISAVLYEALAEGIPFVGADVGGQSELVTPDCGLLIETGTQEEEVDRYVEALRELIDDPELRRRMGAAGRARLESEFTIERMGDRMEALLERATKLAASVSRPLPAEEEAREAALKGVRIATWPSAAAPGAKSWRLRHLVFRVLSAVAMPVYRFGIRLGAHWLEPLKDRVFRALFPRAE